MRPKALCAAIGSQFKITRISSMPLHCHREVRDGFAGQARVPFETGSVRRALCDELSPSTWTTITKLRYGRERLGGLLRSYSNLACLFWPYEIAPFESLERWPGASLLCRKQQQV